MIDSTGDGHADLLVVDTTGDGQPDRPCESYGVDTTGDGRTDALLADTNGDGAISQEELHVALSALKARSGTGLLTTAFSAQTAQYLFQRFGAVFDGTFHYSGYNEFVVETRPWLEGLPHSVEGIFYVECEDDDQRNLAFYDLLAPTCAEARERAREMHQLFLSEFRVAAEHFPLLALRPSNWHEPFVDAHQLEPSW